MKVTATGVSEEVGMLWFNSWLDDLRKDRTEVDKIDVRFVLEDENART